jgi:cold shock CspA family protein
MKTTERWTGRIMRWIPDKAYGFLSAPNGADVFVHLSSFPRGYTPNCGDSFSYVVVQRNDGKLRASNVKPAP